MANLEIPTPSGLGVILAILVLVAVLVLVLIGQLDLRMAALFAALALARLV